MLQLIDALKILWTNLDFIGNVENVVDEARLIEVVQKYPALYNTKLADYHKRNVKQKAWQLVGLEMGTSRKYNSSTKIILKYTI